LNKKITTTLKVVFSLVLLVYVFSKIDSQKLFAVLKETNKFWLFFVFITFNLSKIVSSVRLNYYFKDVGIALSETKNLILYYVGMYYNLFLPGGIGGDGYKIYLLGKRYGSRISSLIQANLLDRLSGLAALVFLAAILFYFSSFARLYRPLGGVALIVALLVYPVFITLHKKLFRNFTTYLKQTTFLAFAVQLIQLLSAFFIILSLPEGVNKVDFMTLFLISSVVAVLPLTVGGVGAREVTFLYGLTLIGQSPAIGIAFSFIFFLVTLVSSAIGLFFVHKPL
jgi:uncharacterized membrane protein YbhN (UPF0104 family)